MQWLMNILRGAIIGVANIIPGVSGGTMMVSMGIYDTLIHCITHLFKEFKKSILTLLPYIIGMVLGIVALASLLSMLLEKYPLPTYTAFIGLILGGLSPLVSKVRHKKLGAVSIGLFVLFFAAIVLMALTGETTNPDTVALSVGSIALLVVMGVIASAAMIVPGVSGSFMLMLFGYYTSVIKAVSMLKDAALALDFAALGYPVAVLLPFGVGIVLGIFAVAKLIEWLLKRFPTQTYCAVLGLVLSSPVAILLRVDFAGVSAVTVIISIVTFALCFAGSMLLARQGKEEAAPETITEE